MENKLSAKDSSIAFVSGFLFCQFFVALIMVLLTMFMHIFSPEINPTSFMDGAIGYLVLTIALDLGLVLIFLFFNKNKHNEIQDKFSWKKLSIFSLIAIISFFCLAPIITILDELLSKIGFSSNSLSYKLNIKNYFISIISLVIAPAVCEELLFRGLIFKGLKKYGKTISITLSALMFAIFHMSIFQTVYPLLIGLLLGIIMYRENNIVYTIVMHGINNFLTLTFAYFKIDFFINNWLYFCFALILLVIFSIFIIYLFKQTKEISKQKLNKLEIIYLSISFALMIILWIILNIYGT